MRLYAIAIAVSAALAAGCSQDSEPRVSSNAPAKDAPTTASAGASGGTINAVARLRKELGVNQLAEKSLTGSRVEDRERHVQQRATVDVAQAPGPELELALRLVCGDVVQDAATHRLDVVDEPLPLRRSPDHRLDQLEVVTGADRLRGGADPLDPVVAVVADAEVARSLAALRRARENNNHGGSPPSSAVPRHESWS